MTDPARGLLVVRPEAVAARLLDNLDADRGEAAVPAARDRIAAGQAMLAELGVTLADLHRAQRPRVPSTTSGPTIAATLGMPYF